MVEDVGAISEETTAEAQNVAGAAAEQTAATTTLAGTATDLAEQSADRRESLDRFVVDRGGGLVGRHPSIRKHAPAGSHRAGAPRRECLSGCSVNEGT